MNKIYFYLTQIYNVIVTKFENFFFKNDNFKQKNELIDNGFIKVEFNRSPEYAFESVSTIQVNKYMKKFVLKENNLKEIIKLIFLDLGLADKITSLTNFNYSIDFFILYETYSISQQDQTDHWYANHWHVDKPFSKNILKVIIPTHDMNDREFGGIQVLTKNISNQLFHNQKNLKNINDDDEFQMLAKKKNALIFNPNLCFHKAGNPKKGNVRKQMMFQLNPSKKWKLNLNIFKKQNKKEPKFPVISYMFNKKENLNKLSI